MKKTTIGDIYKEYAVRLEGNSNMLLSTWLKKKGFDSLGKALEYASRRGTPQKIDFFNKESRIKAEKEFKL